MVATVTRKRIEILVDTPLLARVTREIDAVGITGWTVLQVLAGSGRAGQWREDRVTGSDKVMILSITNQEKAAALCAALEPILTSHGLLLTLDTVEVVRGERF